MDCTSFASRVCTAAFPVKVEKPKGESRPPLRCLSYSNVSFMAHRGEMRPRDMASENRLGKEAPGLDSAPHT